LALPYSTVIGPFMIQANPMSGGVNQLLTVSGYTRATALGTSSPRVMCRMVMMMKAMVEATAWVVIGASAPGRDLKAPPISPASAGSPIQPRPSEVNVMPSCVAEI